MCMLLATQEKTNIRIQKYKEIFIQKYKEMIRESINQESITWRMPNDKMCVILIFLALEN